MVRHSPDAAVLLPWPCWGRVLAAGSGFARIWLGVASAGRIRPDLAYNGPVLAMGGGELPWSVVVVQVCNPP